MMLPSTLKTLNEWTIVGPMGPQVPSHLGEVPIMGVDGGAHFCDRLDVWVGDADSYEEEISSPHIFKHPTQKNQSDLALAFSLFVEPLSYKLHLWGFLGGRRDHELFNLGEALTFLDNHPECQILFYGEDGKMTFHLVGAGHWRFSHHGLFSLGTLKKTFVKLTGQCQYPIIKGENISPLSSLGLSNVGRGDMSLTTEGALFLYYPEGK
jgi:thiamine pyrophosphokinase